MPFTPRLHHFAISAADLEATVAWYRDKLDFKEEYRYAISQMGMRAAFLSLEDFRLEIFGKDGSQPAPEPERDFARYLDVQGLKHIAFAVDDLDATRAELEQRGVQFITPEREVPDSGGERWCFFSDPDGVLLELYQPVAQHEH
jgi:catechol 2,3-dioxygenase-like lactoylglutathione lyase family enzyme